MAPNRLTLGVAVVQTDPLLCLVYRMGIPMRVGKSVSMRQAEMY